MSFGIIEVITLLLSLAGFGVQPNPKAPSADQSLQYAMPDPDIVMHFDAAAVIPGNYKVLLALPNNPAIKGSPELAQMVRQAIGQVEGARGMAKGATGIDIANDINDVTMFLQIVPGKDPTFVATVHGKFSTALVDKIGKLANGTVAKVGSGMMVELAPDKPSIAVTKDGVMLVGTTKLVRDRLADTWKAPAHGPGTSLGFSADAINAHPITAMVLTMSATARKQATQSMPTKNFVSDLINRHKAAAFSMYADGIGWTWVDSSKAGLDSMETMSQGVLELLRAAQIAPRGMAKIALGAIDSYKGVDKHIDEVIKHKADVMKIVESYTGDGNFKISINKDAAKLRLDVRATGKSLSEVVPAGLLLPTMAFGLLVESREPPPPPATIAVPPATTGTKAPRTPALGGRK